MDEVSTKAKLVDSAASAPGLTVTLPRSEVDEALQAGEGESELLLDVVRATNGSDSSSPHGVCSPWASRYQVLKSIVPAFCTSRPSWS